MWRTWVSPSRLAGTQDTLVTSGRYHPSITMTVCFKRRYVQAIKSVDMSSNERSTGSGGKGASHDHDVNHRTCRERDGRDDRDGRRVSDIRDRSGVKKILTEDQRRFQSFRSAVDDLMNKIDMCRKGTTTSFGEMSANISALEEKMKAYRDMSMGARIRTVCAAVLLAVLGVKPDKNTRMTYFSTKKQTHRIASRIEFILASPGFASRDRLALLTDLDFAVNDSMGEAHVQGKSELTAEVNICLRALASSPDLCKKLPVQYCILKEFRELFDLL